jgi:hypothetical protein
MNLNGSSVSKVWFGNKSDDTLQKIEKIMTASGSHILMGDRNSNIPFGDFDNEIMRGGVGNDILDGG